MSVHVIVPVKRRVDGKSRLAACLSRSDRIALTRSMLAHVVETAAAAPAVDEIVLLSPERDDVPTTVRHRIDDASDLNAALSDCMTDCRIRGATIAVILFADLPSLTTGDVAALVDAIDDAAVALAPDHHGTGTNAIALRLPSRFRFGFGPGSLAVHLRHAAAIGAPAAIVRRDGLARDIDRPDDLRQAAIAGMAKHAATGRTRDGLHGA